MTVFTGQWQADMNHYLDRHPAFKFLTEHDMYRNAVAHPQWFDGLWVNSAVILQAFELSDVVVIRADGTRIRMSEHAGAVAKSAVLDTGEIYLDTEW
jgi:hypothetical protein